MKNRLSTFLMVLLTAFMVTCSNCDPKPTDPVVSGTWTIASVTSSQQAAGVTAKYNAAGGTLEITSTTYAIKTAAGVPTAGGSGTAELAVTDVTSGSVTLDPAVATKVKFSYNDLTANSVTLSGNITSGTGKSTVNDLTIKLTR